MKPTSTCPDCGTEIPESAPGGMCPSCMLGAGLDTAASQETIDSGGAEGGGDAPLASPGDTIGRYKLLEQIGEGGFGVVFVAGQTEPIKREVALKLIKPGMDSEEVVARFEAERQALALMDHPNIAQVYDADMTEAGRPYFVMELVKGVPLTEYCAGEKLDTKARLELFTDVCAAVQHAHQKGVIHRDLKPSNILVSPHDGRPVVKVIDFGIAKAVSMELTEKTVFTQLGRMIGSPQYMSPEQAELNALDVDTRSDIYSLGVVLYELLTGTTPLDAGELRSAAYGELQRLIREETPAKPSTRISTLREARSGPSPARPRERTLSRDLDWITMKALEKERDRRYETANALAQDIKRHLRDEPVVAGPPSASYRLRKFARRNKTGLGVAAGFAILLVAATGVSGWQALRATRAERQAASTASAERAAREEAEEINSFLITVFESPDPARSGRSITVAETLDAAAAQLATGSSLTPQRRAKLQFTLSKTYRSLGLHDEAIVLGEQVRHRYLGELGRAHPETLMAGNGLALYYFEAGRRDEAQELWQEVMKLRSETLGEEHPETVVTMGNIALCYHTAGNYKMATETQEKVLEINRRIFNSEHPEVLKAINNLALFYAESGEKDQATITEMRKRVLALRSLVLGGNHLDTIQAEGNLAISYVDEGRLDEAVKLQEKVVAQYLEKLGAQHHLTLSAKGNLAGYRFRSGQKDVAVALQEEVAELSHRKLGPTHPATLMAKGNLAAFYHDTDRHAEALSIGEDVLALTRENFGEKHPDTLGPMTNLAASLARAGRFEEAIDIQKELLMLRREISGSEHAETIACIGSLGDYYDEAGRWREALERREEALEISGKALGPEHESTLVAMSELAHSYRKAGREAEVVKLYEDLLTLRLKLNGEDDSKTLVVMGNLVAAYVDAERFEDAIEVGEKLVTRRRSTLGPEHPDTLGAMVNLAGAYSRSGKTGDAIGIVERALPLLRKEHGPEHADTLGAMTNLGTYYAAVGRLDDAIDLLERSLALKRRALPRSHPFLATAMGHLATCYTDKGRRQDALELGEELLALLREQLGPGHPNALRAMHNLASTHFKAGRIEGCALVIAEHIEYLRRAGHNPDSKTVVDLYNDLTDFAGELMDKVPAPQEAIKRYYADHKDSFRADSASLQTIMINRDEAEGTRIEQRQKVEALRDQIAAGMPFAEAARAHSQDLWAEDGGNRGLVERGTFGTALDNAIFDSEPGTPSLYANDVAFWILLVGERIPGEPLPLADVSQDITKTLEQQKRDALLDSWRLAARKKTELEQAPSP